MLFLVTSFHFFKSYQFQKNLNARFAPLVVGRTGAQLFLTQMVSD